MKDRINKKGITITRLQKLLGYEKSTYLREDWGAMNQLKILKHLNSIIKKETIKKESKEMYAKKSKGGKLTKHDSK